MTQPTQYNRQFSFTNYQAVHPTDPLPGTSVDAELNAIRVTTEGVLASLALIQRDDGALANDSVGLDQLTAEVTVGFEVPTVWVTATAYTTANTVFHGSGFYRCLIAHTAGVFATDLTAVKWELIVDLSAIATVSALQVAVTPAGGISSTNVADAINELDSEKAATSHAHLATGISDSTADGRAFLKATLAAQKSLLGLGSLAFLSSIPVTDINAQITLSGIIEPSALTVDLNDWAPTGIATASTVRLSALNNGIDITGLLAGTDGEIKIFENIGTTYPVTLTPSSSASAAANRFLIPKPLIVGPNSSIVLKYDADVTTPGWRLFDRASHLPRGHLDGLTLSNGSDATNDINIAAGEARGARGILDLVLTTALVKQLDADWAAGTNAGGRYTTAIANGTYHVFLLGKSDGTTDVFFYAASTDPTAVLPSGYIDYRHIGSIVRASAAILAFTQVDDWFLLTTPILDVSNATPGTVANTATLSVPTGLKMQVLLNIVSNSTQCYFSSLDQADMAPSSTLAPLNSSYDNANQSGGQITVFTNASAQVRYRNFGNANIYAATLGWRHPRGRNL